MVLFKEFVTVQFIFLSINKDFVLKIENTKWPPNVKVYNLFCDYNTNLSKILLFDKAIIYFTEH